MSEFVIYGAGGSPFMRAVELTFKEKNTPYRLELMTPMASKEPEHLARHPFGKIPAFRHGDFALYETQAIVRYIDQVVPAPALIPADPRLAARMNQIIGINDCYFFPLVARTIVFNRLIGPALGIPTDEAVVAAAVPEGRRCIAEFNRLLGDQSFLVGHQLSLADLMIAPILEQYAATPEGASMLADTKLSLWLARMQARPSMIETLRIFKA